MDNRSNVIIIFLGAVTFVPALIHFILTGDTTRSIVFVMVSGFMMAAGGAVGLISSYRRENRLNKDEEKDDST